MCYNIIENEKEHWKKFSSHSGFFCSSKSTIIWRSWLQEGGSGLCWALMMTWASINKFRAKNWNNKFM